MTARLRTFVETDAYRRTYWRVVGDTGFGRFAVTYKVLGPGEAKARFRSEYPDCDIVSVGRAKR